MKFPLEILSLYIGEVLTMESRVKNIIKNSKILIPFSIHEKRKERKEIENYTHPKHLHDICMCDGCKIWMEICRKNYKRRPLGRYIELFRDKNIHCSWSDKTSKIYYSDKPINYENGRMVDDLPFIDLSNDEWKIPKNNIEAFIACLLLREKDPIFIEKHYTDWFSRLIKDRLPFTDDTIIVENIREINVNVFPGKNIPKYNFYLKSYKGNFTYFHVRLMRKRLLSVKGGSFSLANLDNVIDAEIINDILNIKIRDYS
jgi:hypothetical protein